MVERRREARVATLDERLRALPSLVVAYSGGVDSAFLAWAATRALGDRALCVTADSPSYPERHRSMALDHRAPVRLAARDHPHRRAEPARVPRQRARSLLPLQARALHAPDRPRRGRAGSRPSPTAATPTTAATIGPGRRAAREFGVISPLDEAGLTKDDIRALSHEAGLPTWDEPASACLSSRIPYFSEVTDEKLRAIERAEEAVRALGLPRRARPSPRRGRAPRARHATRWRARSSPAIAAAIDARVARARVPLRDARSARATGSAASTKACACARLASHRCGPADLRATS